MGIQVSGVVESKSKKGNSIKVDGEWYGTFNASDLPAEWKDNVTFEYNMDKTGRYRNIVKGSVKVLDSAGASAVTGAGAAPRSNNLLGVELGHASNLAMRVTEQMAWSQEDLGGQEFWKAFVKNTDTAFKIMKSLRARYEEEGKAPIATEEEEEVVVIKPDATPDVSLEANIEDLF